MINWDLDYKVIDMHTHMGAWAYMYSPDKDADGMVRSMDDSNVDFIVCCHFEDIDGVGDQERGGGGRRSSRALDKRSLVPSIVCTFLHLFLTSSTSSSIESNICSGFNLPFFS